MSNLEREIFKQGSTTYFWSSRLFPKKIRQDVSKLYSFVRVVDDYVDVQPQQPAKCHAVRKAWEAAKNNSLFEDTTKMSDTVDERIIKNIISLQRKYAFNREWIDAFFRSMQADLDGRSYKTLQDSLDYVYGSAEVIGLMMSKIMNLKPQAYDAARMQGRAMQWINFVRDIAEDNALQRCYFPKEDLQKFGLADLQEETCRTHPKNFEAFMRMQLDRYREWQSVASKGFSYIPRRLRLSLQTAADMYQWTADQIATDPFIVFECKVKPSKNQILQRYLVRLLSPAD